MDRLDSDAEGLARLEELERMADEARAKILNSHPDFFCLARARRDLDRIFGSQENRQRQRRTTMVARILSTMKALLAAHRCRPGG